MKNLFDYAKKELSQDAFLSWLFASWDDPTCKGPVMSLFKKFELDIDYNDIKNIQCFNQICKIDIAVVIETKDKFHLLFIEDKTFSDAHTNQLLVYDSKIFGGPLKNEKHDFRVLEEINRRYGKILYIPDDSISNAKFYNFKVHRVFYKTADISDQDKLFLDECKNLPFNFSARQEAGTESWKVVNINDIYEILKPYKNNTNEIIDMYIDHIVNVYDLVNTTDIPNEKSSLQEWKYFFTNNFKEYFEDLGYLVDIGIFNGTDAYMLIKPKNGNDDLFDFNSLQNAPVGLLLTNKTMGIISAKLSTAYLSDEDMKNMSVETTSYKLNIQNRHDGFGEPLIVKDSYMKYNAVTIAQAKLPCNTVKEIKDALLRCLRQIEHIKD